LDGDVEFRTFAAAHLLAPGSLTRQFGYGRAMEAYLRRGESGERWPRALSIYQTLAWRLLLLELWARHFLQARNVQDWTEQRA
jgi:hypothetical protein